MKTPLKAIRQKCLDCCCESAKEVRLCTCADCSLFQYRLGKNPARRGMGGNIQKAREAKKQLIESVF